MSVVIFTLSCVVFPGFNGKISATIVSITLLFSSSISILAVCPSVASFVLFVISAINVLSPFLHDKRALLMSNVLNFYDLATSSLVFTFNPPS